MTETVAVENPYLLGNVTRLKVFLPVGKGDARKFVWTAQGFVVLVSTRGKGPYGCW